ncbi:uncharacterized protein E5676_scaffold352G004180 [Cucumis melo var. makuwa]|uniref:Embryo defective protein n=1 Tax=Cucumis melo var. makuwa TaxID=1194695 RepID=A0A5D3DNS5_CUCMM|nr:uncharacterized protein E6C27_scaffold236G001860 [Cucumis melo var. makuwa]TYK25283.1 uncharacterized protein E5676_scaffold352G004180 [Cucumis melo var. makuwa]
MKAKIVFRKIYDYVRYDLKEIAFPSSLPDPPHVKKRPKLTWHDRFLVLKEASRLYAASWVRDIGPELRPHEYKVEESENKTNSPKSAPKEKEPSTLEDLAVAARGGMETLKPALQRVYMTRAAAYRDALKKFIDGYQEGIQQVMEKKDASDSQKGNVNSIAAGQCVCIKITPDFQSCLQIEGSGIVRSKDVAERKCSSTLYYGEREG